MRSTAFCRKSDQIGFAMSWWGIEGEGAFEDCASQWAYFEHGQVFLGALRRIEGELKKG